MFLKLKLPTVFVCVVSALSIKGCTNPPFEPTNGEPTISSLTTLDKVKERGTLNCGISGNLPGFSDLKNADPTQVDRDRFLQESSRGFDVDICRAIASAIFNDPQKVTFSFLDTQARFAELNNGNIDVLSRTTTWTLDRDVSINIEFAPIVFYDGQGVMVKKDSGITSIGDLAGKVVCVEITTTNEDNIRDTAKKIGISEIKALESKADVYRLYEEDECQAVTSDRSQLASVRTELGNPENHILLPDVISKEPLAPAVAEGDVEWLEVVRWVVFALIEAEELGITQANLETMKASSDPEIVRFLGLETTNDSLGARLNLSPQFAQSVVEHVGNYGDIYERNLGKNAPISIDRGLNNLWNSPEEKGLLYSPPFR